MNIQPTVIHILHESALGLGTQATCDSLATAVYYLAVVAASQGLPFEIVTADRVYRIGHVNYVLEERLLFATEDVGDLRRHLEAHSMELKTEAEVLPPLRLLGVCSGLPREELPVTATSI